MRILRYYPEQAPINWPEDCRRIQKALMSVDIYISALEAQCIWEIHSEKNFASWHDLPESDEQIIDFLTIEAGPQP
jgi:hypothetical protein